MSYSDPYINAIFLACRKTSKSLIRDFGEVEKLQVSLKGVSDFVSLADTKAEKMLIKELTYSYPKINIIAEETGVIKNSDENIRWIIDPLDGTKEFIKKNDEFTCNLALIENNISTLGFVSVPVRELIYFGGKRFGSKLVDKNKAITEVKYKKLSGVTRVVASKSHLNEETKKFIKDIQGKVELIQAGSSLKFIKIAEGLADIYPRLAPTSEWDTAAAHAILEGAGGKVLQLNGKDIIYGKKNILNPYFIASGFENLVDS